MQHTAVSLAKEVDISDERVSHLLTRAWSVIEKDRPTSERRLLDDISEVIRELRSK